MSNWSGVPTKSMLLGALAAQQVEAFMAQLAQEFRDRDGDNDYVGKAHIGPTSAQWFVEVPYDIPEMVQHAIRDALADKFYDQIHFNKFGHFDSKHMRVSITINFNEV